MPRALCIATLYPNAERPTFGTFVARQFEALAARGDWDVTVINPIGLPPVAAGRYAALARAASDAVESGVTVLRPRFALVPALSARWNPSLIARRVLPIARRLHGEHPFALVDAQFFYPDGPAAAKIARALGLPLSIKARGADIHYWGAQGFARRRMLDAARQAAGLLAVSQALKADMVALDMPEDTIAVHYTGLDRAQFRVRDRDRSRAEIAALGVPGDGRLLVSVGALIARKGQALAIRALAALPADVRLALAGTGADEAALRKLAGALGVGERVHLLGSVQHDLLPHLLTAADAMVLPAASEGLANAWVEALACGTPIVIADAGGARELLTSPVAGRIVARDPAAIAAGVADVLAGPPPREAVAATVENFSWDENAAALSAYYDRLIASG
ncbi:glycosyltransferase [Novosphingobium sp. Gsoil 351]|uniref:glycosyltransferase n=1 Tax=Novosphingobium sp. Gsoil 351 TaxID=2675225 RepID=UPI0012B4FB4D|nr:glycosyltransferase [Novosphingobium sp. Gsoil 351]QGN55999.1 glycosyltransferase [Novosphingobium sp. Gsoil 351]